MVCMPPVSVRINCLGYVADGYRTKEWYGFTDAGRKWLQDKGCEWTKITAEPGDLLLCKSLPYSKATNTNRQGTRARRITISRPRRRSRDSACIRATCRSKTPARSSS